MSQQSQSIDVLGQRVSSLEGSVAKLSGTVESFIAKVQEGSRTPWAVILVALGTGYAIMGGVGWLAYNPIQTSLNEVKTNMVEQARSNSLIKDALTTYIITSQGENFQTFVTKTELDNRSMRGSEDRKRSDDRIAKLEAYLQESVVARPEHEEKWIANRQQFADIQRQLDELKTVYHSTYNTRDALQELKGQVNELLLQQLKRGGT